MVMISGLKSLGIYVGHLVVSAEMSELLHSTNMLHTFIEGSLGDLRNPLWAMLSLEHTGACWDATLMPNQASFVPMESILHCV